MPEAPATIIDGIEVCLFDAYGTLFDVASAAEHCRDDLGDATVPLAQLWRTKQIDYTRLLTLMDLYDDFWQVTGHSLDYAMESLGIASSSLRAKLMELYLNLDAYPEVVGLLETLRERDFKTAILSNGSPSMLISAVKSSGIEDLLDGVISVDSLKVYKPHPSVYQHGCNHWNTEPKAVCFMSSNAWDVAGAASFGLRVVWVNRTGALQEHIPGDPERVISDLSELPGIVQA